MIDTLPAEEAGLPIYSGQPPVAHTALQSGGAPAAPSVSSAAASASAGMDIGHAVPAPPSAPAGDPSPAWSDDWRERMAGGDRELHSLLGRYASPTTAARALKDAKDLIRSGGRKLDIPEAGDTEALAEWRSANGVPADPSGYTLPDSVRSRLTDRDKPVLAAFAEAAHRANQPQSVIDFASEWFFGLQERAAGERIAADRAAIRTAEEELRQEWSPGEYRANLTIAKRFIADIPGVGQAWESAVLPDGRVLGSVVAFIRWAAEQGAGQYGDAAFVHADGEAPAMSRKAEIEHIRNADFDRYEREGLDRELTAITEREMARKKGSRGVGEMGGGGKSAGNKASNRHTYCKALRQFP
jgi:hypothetical protein